ncbi:hypothetical protein JK636_18890 [Clostridium sp. YIM B02515]|uniref:Uncharacterized protein n=1 Tax=Clostridium rhizosphaerae TaxID=2803861 RepID=A0ABS1TGN4_9CLOT|nr:hypothetical protein [Clostridium rhizosphaerae]MBL4937776.1 hypothetical protein [Clostridium rhizosphaerae]
MWFGFNLHVGGLTVIWFGLTRSFELTSKLILGFGDWGKKIMWLCII